MKYRKKPVVVEAVQWTGDNIHEIYLFSGRPDFFVERPGDLLTIETPEGNMKAKYGDYIIKGVAGELYPCKPDIFKETYEPAE